jgi:hypothetical protein
MFFDRPYMPPTRQRRVLGLALIGIASLALSAGCEKRPDEAVAAARPPAENAVMSSGDILKTYRPNLAVIEVSWEEPSPLLVGWRSQGRVGTGVIVACDGRRAIVLTSRCLVDPGFGPNASARRRNVAFRVSTPGQRSVNQSESARLVAVFMNGGDLALLRIGAPTREPFIVPILPRGSLRAGDAVTVVGPPAEQGFTLSTGAVSNFWENSQTAADTLQISISSGPAATAGVVFAHQGGRLVGIVGGNARPSATPGAAAVVPAELLRRTDFWDYLMEEGPTRELLGLLR